jgi:hypothetical protein
MVSFFRVNGSKVTLLCNLLPSPLLEKRRKLSPYDEDLGFAFSFFDK